MHWFVMATHAAISVMHQIHMIYESDHLCLSPILRQQSPNFARYRTLQVFSRIMLPHD